MDQSRLLVITAAAALTVAVVVVLLVTARARRRMREELRASRAAIEALHAQIDQLAQRSTGGGRAHDRPGQPAGPGSPEFVITSLRESGAGALVVPDDEPRGPAVVRQLSAPEFASVAVGESLVKIVSFGHGLRRALSAENRNRIRFEVRREVKRARRQRHRDLKSARRHLRKQQSGGDRTDLREDAA